MEKFKNKYRISSARMKNWDYTRNAAYFITICTKNRTCFFGTIEKGVMQLSNIGIIADLFLYEMPKYARNVEIGEFIVMPNHIHCILILNDNALPVAGTLHVETLHATSLQCVKNKFMAQISPKPGSVSTIIRSYKSAVTKHAHRLGFEFAWQERFYDHIIRNNDEYQRIAKYITHNPENWNEDKFNGDAATSDKTGEKG